MTDTTYGGRLPSPLEGVYVEVNFDPLVAIQGETRHAAAALHNYALMEVGGCRRSLQEPH
jgi:hypothetical protein